jgi:ATP-dependent RNA helicase DDX46/PRP5
MKLNYIKQENVHDQDSENFKVFEEELEINDFPQQARWRITSKVVFYTCYNQFSLI